MQLKLIGLTSGFLLLIGPAASAHVDPPPPPSGIVVHLFGPGSAASKIMPQSSAGAAPDMHEMLHQMFITGDPDAQPGQSVPKGRAGDGATPGH